MEVIIQQTPEEAARLVARIVAHDLRANPHLVLGLATGQTMERVYRQRVRLHHDLDAECRAYEALIQRFGGIDLQLLGIGKAGHIGFNEPLSALRSRTRVKALTPTTLKQNAGLFGGEDRVPRRAITMGVGTILEARRCLLLATGSSKAEVIAQAVEG